MPASFYESSKVKIFSGSQKIRRGYCGSRLIYTCGNPVTYISNGITYVEDAEEGMTVLSPTSFTPGKSGWDFIGWSISAASHNVQTNLVIGESPITLYAVWRQGTYIPDVPLSFTYDGAPSGLNYTPGGNWTASVYADELTVSSNPTEGYIYPQIIVAGTVIREWVAYSELSKPTEESSSRPGYGGKETTISGSGTMTASISFINAGEHQWVHGGNIHVSNVVKKGSSDVIFSIG